MSPTPPNADAARAELALERTASVATEAVQKRPTPEDCCLVPADCDRQLVVTTTKLTPLQEAQQRLHEAARQFGEAPIVEASRFTDLSLRRAAIEFTRELLCSLLGLNHSGLEEHIDDLMNLAEESLKAPGGIHDPELSKRVRAYLKKWSVS